MNEPRPQWSTPNLLRLNATGRAENDPQIEPEIDSTVEGGPGGFSSG